MMTPSRLERGSTANAVADFGADRRHCGKPQTALRRRRMERLWKNEEATRRERFSVLKPRNRLNKPNLFATRCHRLPTKSHGKEGVDGSSPSEGSKRPAKWPIRVVCAESQVRKGSLSGAECPCLRRVCAQTRRRSPVLCRQGRTGGRTPTRENSVRRSCDDSENTRRLRISSFYADTPGELLLTAVAMKTPRML
jgi:hypothetical protein